MRLIVSHLHLTFVRFHNAVADDVAATPPLNSILSGQWQRR
jgi:hypothetical protein